MLRKEYFYCRQRNSTQYITFNKGGRGEYVLLYRTLQSCNRDVLHRPLREDSDKIPVARTSTGIYILHLSGWEIIAHPLAEVWAAKIWQRAISGTGSG